MSLFSKLPKREEVSHIGRDLDWNYPTHRRIMLFAAGVTVVMLAYRLLSGIDFIQALILAVGAGAFSFGAWVIGRELDPDHDLSGFVAAGLTAVGLVIWPLPYAFALGTLVIQLRTVNQTTGLPPTLFDHVMILGSLGLSLAFDGLWPLGILVALGYLLNALLPRPDRPLGFIFAALALGLTIICSLIFAQLPAQFPPDTLTLALVILISLLVIPLLLRPASFVSPGDMTGEALIPARIQAGRWLAFLAGLALVLWAGDSGFSALLPVWAALLATGLRGFLPLNKL